MVVDLHGFPTMQAVEEAESAVARAWEEARRWVTLVHGAADVRHWMHTRPLSRGSINWALRGVLRRGEWDRYVYGRRSRRHRVGDGEMTLAVRPPLPV
jgi:hypothetical protein